MRTIVCFSSVRFNSKKPQCDFYFHFSNNHFFTKFIIYLWKKKNTTLNKVRIEGTSQHKEGLIWQAYSCHHTQWWKTEGISFKIKHKKMIPTLSTFIYRDIGNSREKAMAPHSSILAWKIPWTAEPGALQSMGSLGVGHEWATSLSLFTFMYWRRKWQPTPVFLPGESQGWGSLVGCHLWGRTESDTTEAT